MSGVATIVHHDDGKEKWQSHEVYLKYPITYEGFEFSQRGYGSTLEEAYQDFIAKYNNAMKNLEAQSHMILETDALEILEVDCFGDPIFRLNKKMYGKLYQIGELHTKVLYAMYLEVGSATRSGDVNVVRDVLNRIENDKFYFADRSEPLYAKDYGKTWHAYKSEGTIYK